jgi:hypothetical protein
LKSDTSQLLAFFAAFVLTRDSQALTQDRKKLLAFTKFTFDLNDPKFVRYYVSRTGDRINELGGTSYFAFSPSSQEEWSETCADILAAKDGVNQIRRAKLQDCWEIYQQYEL